MPIPRGLQGSHGTIHIAFLLCFLSSCGQVDTFSVATKQCTRVPFVRVLEGNVIRVFLEPARVSTLGVRKHGRPMRPSRPSPTALAYGQGK